ncbi:MAG: hypothetical protein PUG15_02040 [Bacteroidales bacterium]|nr:hypothetical protein [Bacteroidales bacterium]
MKRENLKERSIQWKTSDYKSVSVFYNDILQSLKELDLSKKKNGERTKNIKVALMKLGHKKKCRVNTNCINDRIEEIQQYSIENKLQMGQSGVKSVEWLYDMFWYRDYKDCYKTNTHTHYVIKEQVLAVESEWLGKRRGKSVNDGDDIYGAVKYDFLKLITSNSTYKLMILKEHFQDRKDNKLQDLYEYFDFQVQQNDNFKKGDSVLCVVYKKDFDDFYYEEFIKK